MRLSQRKAAATDPGRQPLGIAPAKFLFHQQNETFYTQDRNSPIIIFCLPSGGARLRKTTTEMFLIFIIATFSGNHPDLFGGKPQHIGLASEESANVFEDPDSEDFGYWSVIVFQRDNLDNGRR